MAGQAMAEWAAASRATNGTNTGDVQEPTEAGLSGADIFAITVYVLAGS